MWVGTAGSSRCGSSGRWCCDAEEQKASLSKDNDVDDVLFKLREDPRVTRLGAFLRTSSLDELPQLVNVVRGEMSLVGPRPHVPSEVDAMDVTTRRRHAVAPGMTGLWQVSGRSDLSRDEASDLDTFYADNWTLSGDLSILRAHGQGGRSAARAPTERRRRPEHVGGDGRLAAHDASATMRASALTPR